MLFREALQNELDKNGERLSRFIEDQRAVLEDLASSLGLLLTSSPDELEEKKDRIGHLGAFPADELFNDRSIRKPFDVDWSNHAEARDWADIVLARGRPLRRTEVRYMRARKRRYRSPQFRSVGSKIRTMQTGRMRRMRRWN